MSPSRFSAEVADRITDLLAAAAAAPAAGVLVALSGGPDSVALLLAAADWTKETGRPLAAAHLDHGLRGADSEADAEFCRGLCAKLDIPLHLRREDPRAAARLRGGGLEEAGRHLRRRFFHSVLTQDESLAAVATGHHRDDQIETVVMRLFRGTGPAGLRGIRPVQGTTIHPLLGFGRRDILAFLEEHRQPWRQDATNEGAGNVRARVRRELLPLVRDIFGPGGDRGCARLADLLEVDLALLDRLTAEALSGVEIGRPGTEDGSGPAELDIPRLLAMAPALAGRTLLSWLVDGSGQEPATIEFVHVANILAWLREGTSGSGLDLPGGLTVRRNFDRLSLTAADSGTPPLRSAADFRILVDRVPYPADPDEHCRREAVAATGREGPWNLTCPSSVLVGNLRLRNWRDGDRFRPFGLDGTRKLSDLLQDRRIPADRRAGILVACDDAGILWVVGLARAERTRMLPSAGTAITLTVARRDAGDGNQDRAAR